MWRCWLLIRRTKTSWYSTSLHRATELKIPCILSFGCLAVNENVGLFSKACVEKGVDDENLWGQIQVPASWLNLHVLMMSARCCTAPHHWQKLSTATTSLPLILYVLLARSLKATEFNSLLDVNYAFKLWAFTQLLGMIYSSSILQCEAVFKAVFNYFLATKRL